MSRAARPSGRWLRLAWTAAVAAYAVPFLLGLPSAVEQYNALTGSALTMGFQTWTSPELRAALASAGVPISMWTTLRLASDLLTTLGFAAMGLLIFVRRASGGFGLFVALFLVTFGLAGGGSSYAALSAEYPKWQGWLSLWASLPWLAFYVFFYTFPSGRFVPRWTVIAAPAILVLFLIPRNLVNVPLSVLLLMVFGSALFAQAYRYLRVSNAIERAQAKWVTFAIAVIALGEFVGQGLLPASFPALMADPVSRLCYGMALVLGVPAFLLVPLAVAIAILRYRLWDIDVLIRRTLVYSVLTALLALAYFGSVVVLQSLLSTLTGQSQSTLVTVLSTLVIAGLFVPLRRRVQSVIDRRLYRRKYDAARTLAAFGASLRDETNLDQLAAHLTEVVDETMQPAGVMLWLK